MLQFPKFETWAVAVYVKSNLGYSAGLYDFKLPLIKARSMKNLIKICRHKYFNKNTLLFVEILTKSLYLLKDFNKNTLVMNFQKNLTENTLLMKNKVFSLKL